MCACGDLIQSLSASPTTSHPCLHVFTLAVTSSSFNTLQQMSKQPCQSLRLEIKVKMPLDIESGNLSKMDIDKMHCIAKSTPTGILKGSTWVLESYSNSKFGPEWKMRMAAHKDLNMFFLLGYSKHMVLVFL